MVRRLLFLLLLITSTTSYGQISEWLKAVENSVYANDIATDDDGNIYIVGGSETRWQKRFDSLKVGNNVVTSANFHNQNLHGVYLLKIDSTGAIQWARFMGSPYWLSIPRVAINDSNDVIVGLNFGDSLFVENDTLVRKTIPASPYTVNSTCYMKFDDQGNYHWAHVIPSTSASGFNYGECGIDIDNNYIMIRHDSIDYSIAQPVKNFVYKIDNSGSLTQKLETEAIVASWNVQRGDYKADALGNHLVSVHDASDTILKKINSSGNIISALRGDGNAHITRIEKGPLNMIYILGWYDGGRLKIGNKTSYSYSTSWFNWGSPFILQYEPFSNTVLWLKSFSCTPLGWNNRGNLKITDNSEVIVSGHFGGSICIDGNTFFSNLPDSVALKYIMKFDFYGNYKWIKILETRDLNDINATGLATYKHNIYSALYSYADSVYVENKNAKGNNGVVYRIRDLSNEVNGKVYVDANNSGQPDNGDYFKKDLRIQITGNEEKMTDKNGYYEFLTLKGNHTIQIPFPPKYAAVSPTSHSASFSAFNQIDSTNHFKLIMPSGINDVRVSISPLTEPRLAFGRLDVFIDYENVGSTILSDTLFYDFDTNLIVDSVYPMPLANTTGKLAWAYSNFKPLDKEQIFVSFSLDSMNIFDTILHRVEINPITTDTFKTDNIDSNIQVVIGAYDPNDKLVDPSGDVTPEYCENGNVFTYTIRFQNTGNDTAYYVRIRDTIDLNLDLSSFDMIGSSHNYEIVLVENNVIDFVFKNIRLPDSNKNQKLSNGYIKYQIKTVKGLVHGDNFQNTAYIYFDNNEAVVTNTAKTNIYDWTGEEEFAFEEKGIFVYPNPNDGNFIIQIDDDLLSDCRIVIRDVMGRGVYSSNTVRFDRGRTSLSFDQLDRGMYIVQVEVGDRHYTTRIMIQ